ncbi:unnamed protein product [Pichia kudriavzevii]
MFLVLLFVMAVMVLAVVMLPTMSGLVTYTRTSKHREELSSSQSHKQTDFYETPDVEEEEEEEEELNSGKTSGLKAKLRITEADLPVKLELVGEGELKRRVRSTHKGPTSGDPTVYDYDIDELIAEENAREEMEKRAVYGSADV